jgi:predicted RNA binding protein YcfA (HicA-like mRNA interferase family)
MSPKLPVISGEELIRVLRKFGYEIANRRVVTYAYANEAQRQRLPVTVPLHKELAPGTLKSILADACVSAEELLGAM